MTATPEKEIAMKVPQAAYDSMKSRIQTLSGEIGDMREAIVAEGRARDVEKRLRWDCLWKVVPSEEIMALYDEHDCNDDHVDTALRGIMRDIARDLELAEGAGGMRP